MGQIFFQSTDLLNHRQPIALTSSIPRYKLTTSPFFAFRASRWLSSNSEMSTTSSKEGQKSDGTQKNKARQGHHATLKILFFMHFFCSFKGRALSSSSPLRKSPYLRATSTSPFGGTVPIQDRYRSIPKVPRGTGRQ